MRATIIERIKEKGAHRLLALLLVFVLALNILVTALPFGRFDTASADTIASVCIMTLDVRSGKSAYLRLALSEAPVIQDEPEGSKTLTELSFVTVTNGKMNDIYYDPFVYMSYSDGVLAYNIYSEEDSIIKVYSKDPEIVTGVVLTSTVNLETGNPVESGVTSIKFSDMPSIESINVSGTSALGELLLYNLPRLSAVDASDCSIERIAVSDTDTLREFDCSGNRLTYNDIIIPTEQPASYNYASQSDFAAPACVRAGGIIDLSDCFIAISDGTQVNATEFKWYLSDGTEVSDKVTQPSGVRGEFVIDESLAGKRMYCVMTHATYPGLPTLKTTEFDVVKDLQFCITPAYGMELSFCVSESDAEIVLSDGSAAIPTIESCSDHVKLSVTLPESAKNDYVAVRSPYPVTEISVKSANIEEIDTTLCTELESLEIDGVSAAPLSELDLSANTKLENLTVVSTKIRNIDLSNNTRLKNIDVSNNLLTDIKLPAGVVSFKADNNQNLARLTALDRCSDTLQLLSASKCGITYADLTDFVSLTDINLSNNSISNILIPSNDYTSVDLSNNLLNFETLPSSPLTADGCEYKYDNQMTIETFGPYNVGSTVDLGNYVKSSAEGDSVTGWLIGESGVRVSDSDGIFTIPDECSGDRIHFEFKSEKFPGLTISSEYENVNEVITYTNAAIIADGAGPFSFSITSTKPVSVDWGDGTKVEYTPSDGDYSKPIEISGTAVADSEGLANISIITAGEVTSLDLSRESDEVKALAISTELWDELEELDLSGNGLGNIDISKNTALEKLDLSGNSFTFDTLPEFDGDYKYDSQSDIKIDETVNPDEKVDLSDTGATSYNWKNTETGSAINPKTYNNGVFTFGDLYDGVKAACTMTNPAFPDLTLKTTTTTLASSDAVFEKPVAVLYTELAANQKFSLTVSCDERVYIDWGNGTPVSTSVGGVDNATVEKELTGKAVRIYTNGHLTMLSATDMKITSAALSSATDLEILDLSGNKLKEIDLSKNTKLSRLDLSDNNFIFPTLPAKSTAADYDYSPQALYKIPEMKASGTTVTDLAKLKTTGATMGYIWYKKNSSGNDTMLSVLNDYTSPNSGEFVFKDSLAGETLYCVVSNSQYPDLRITTTEMSILAGGDLVMTDSTGLVYDINFAEGTTCKASDGTVIPAGDLIKSTTSTKPMLTFSAKKFTDSAYISSSALFAKVKAKLSSFDASRNMHYIYDLTLLDSKGQEVSALEGSLTVTLKYPGNAIASKYKSFTFYMFHYVTSGTKAGTMEEIPITASADGLTFSANSFSPYILVYQQKTESSENNNSGSSGGNNSSGGTNNSGSSGNNSGSSGKGESSPSTGDDSEEKVMTATVIFWVSIVVMAAAAAASIAAFRRRKSSR